MHVSATDINEAMFKSSVTVQRVTSACYITNEFLRGTLYVVIQVLPLWCIHFGQLLSLDPLCISVLWLMLHCGGRSAQLWALLYPFTECGRL